MKIGITLQLFIDATPRINMSGITACWWDSTDPSQIASPAGKTVGASTDAMGTLSLDLSSVSALSVGAPGFLLLYLPDAQSPQEALVFAGVVETSEVISGIPLGYIAESDASASAAIAVHQAMLAQVAAESTALDRAATAEDRIATAADREQTGIDAAAASSAKTAAELAASSALDSAGAASLSADTSTAKAAEAAASAEATAADRLQTGADVITATEKSDIATAKAKEASDSANSALTSETKASDSALIAQAAAAIYSDLQINMMQMANSMIQTQTIVAQHYAFA